MTFSEAKRLSLPLVNLRASRVRQKEQNVEATKPETSVLC